MKPPEDVSPSALFLKLCEPEPSEEVDYPRYNAAGQAVGKLRVRVLAQEHHDSARINAEKELLARGIPRESLTNPATREVLGDTIARHVLAKACMTAEALSEDENGAPIYGMVFHGAKDLAKIRSHELATLFAMYEMVQDKYGPYEGNVHSDEDVTAWIKRLVEGASAFPLSRVPLPQLARLASLLAVRAYSLSATLESQWESLPDTLRSSLETFGLGTGSFGVHAESTDETGGGKSATEQAELTIEMAARVAEDLYGQ
jgi:hypothetical protein